MTKEEAQTTLRAILNENIVLDDPKGVSLATWRDRAYIAANDLARAAVAEARAPLVEALRAVEWVRHGCEYEKNSWCPACDTEEHYGHAPDCPLAAALAKETPDA